jgi:hypothetical protein
MTPRAGIVADVESGCQEQNNHRRNVAGEASNALRCRLALAVFPNFA